MGKKRIVEQKIEEVERASQKIGKIVNIAKKGLKAVRVCIQATYNNTVITMTDIAGNVLAWSSAGSVGFKGTKKSTPFAASKVAEAMAEKILKLGVEELTILVKGVGSGRDSAIRTLASRGFNIIEIKDMTSLPHGGCRPPKIRRV